jgi:hypothetical protein
MTIQFLASQVCLGDSKRPDSGSTTDQGPELGIQDHLLYRQQIQRASFTLWAGRRIKLQVRAAAQQPIELISRGSSFGDDAES